MSEWLINCKTSIWKALPRGSVRVAEGEVDAAGRVRVSRTFGRVFGKVVEKVAGKVNLSVTAAKVHENRLIRVCPCPRGPSVLRLHRPLRVLVNISIGHPTSLRRKSRLVSCTNRWMLKIAGAVATQLMRMLARTGIILVLIRGMHKSPNWL